MEAGVAEAGNNKEAACANSMLNSAQNVEFTPTHILVRTGPKRTVRMPTRDDDLQQTVRSYNTRK